MQSRWSRRIALGIVSALTATFAFVGFVEGTAGASAHDHRSPRRLNGTGDDDGIGRFHQPTGDSR